MIYGKELEEYIRNMEKLAKGAKEKAQDPKTRAPRKYVILADDYKLRAEIAREAQQGHEARRLLYDLAKIATDAKRALEKLDTDTERQSKVKKALEDIVETGERLADYWEGDTDGKG